MKILNLTQHKATQDQLDAGVEEPVYKEKLCSYLNFDSGIPTYLGMKSRAEKLALYAKNEGYDKVMIGGAPYFMPVLEFVMKEAGLKVCYAFSKRVSEEKEINGVVVKVNSFKHLGFYEA